MGRWPSIDCIFNGFASYDPQGIVSYQWNLGDGTTATGQSVDHTYADSGTYLVMLTVTDAIGQTGSESQWVDLSGAPPTGPYSYSATATSAKTVSLSASHFDDQRGPKNDHPARSARRAESQTRRQAAVGDPRAAQVRLSSLRSDACSVE